MPVMSAPNRKILSFMKTDYVNKRKTLTLGNAKSRVGHQAYGEEQKTRKGPHCILFCCEEGSSDGFL